MRRGIAIVVAAFGIGVVAACGSPTDNPAPPPPVTGSASDPAGPTSASSLSRQPSSARSGPATSTRSQPWVLPDPARKSIEEETHASYTNLQSVIKGSISGSCPNHTQCVNLAVRVGDPAEEPDVDCYVEKNVIPNPLREHGTITVVVNNLCGPDQETSASATP
ncbi:hypothetical protein [Amycolatopsis sp. GM8]|uniref:hypothetical protein n=1 Tax=Amycolatopsis sp. GM8 TaxID=2896530 RepID=UPI001F465CA2|nr:hypothetical protein [Amycolatopsis sp. GM8]